MVMAEYDERRERQDREATCGFTRTSPMLPHRNNSTVSEMPLMRAHLVFTNHYAPPRPLSGLAL